MKEIILLKLGELVLKGLNRRVFEDTLVKNIRRRISPLGKFNIRSRQSTITV
ncbi:MAG TPA: tRNA 4-thiouridine(8) synthase ThiI, partial [Ruminococcaceae bacterium]|nr:tRNA 4-thiouridine(8) synthase ThiI [Oscillospiraceae bacterium]